MARKSGSAPRVTHHPATPNTHPFTTTDKSNQRPDPAYARAAQKLVNRGQGDENLAPIDVALHRSGR